MKRAIVAGGAAAAVVMAGFIAVHTDAESQPVSQPTASPVAPEQPRESEPPLSPSAEPNEPRKTIPTYDFRPAFPTRAEGPVIAQALVARNRNQVQSWKLITKQFPAGTSQETVEAQLNKWRKRGNVITADWTTKPSPASDMPNDPLWPPLAPQEDRPTAQTVMSRIGLCCSRNGLLDAWPDRIQTVKPKRSVNIAIIDNGIRRLATPGFDEDSMAELKSRFLGEWDQQTVAHDLTGRAWRELPITYGAVDESELHGMSMAAAAIGQAGNLTMSAGSAGAEKAVQFGLFRFNDYPGQLARGLEVDEALLEILQQNLNAAAGRGDRFWSVVNMSFSLPERLPSTTNELLLALNRQGVLLIVSAGNYRNRYKNDEFDQPVVELGKNLISSPAVSPNVISVANFGEFHRYPTDGGGFQYRLKEMINLTSNSNPFVDLAAPGDMLVGFGQFGPEPASGTSGAAATLSGIAAGLMAQQPDNYNCVRKKFAEDRLPCLIKLRNLIIGSTSNVDGLIGSPETYQTQGAGLIDVPTLQAGVPSRKVPAAPQLTAAAFVLDDPFTGRVKVQWKPVKDATGYQLFINGDGTRNVTVNELDPTIAEPAGDEFNPRIPAAWTRARIPLPTLPATATEAEFTGVDVGFDDELRVSVVAVRRDRAGTFHTTSFPGSALCVADRSCHLE